jgi:hypothetical protein
MSFSQVLSDWTDIGPTASAALLDPFTPLWNRKAHHHATDRDEHRYDAVPSDERRAARDDDRRYLSSQPTWVASVELSRGF